MPRELTLGFCPVGNGTDISPFDYHFGKKQNIGDSMKGVDAVVFWGGTDIHPSLYDEPAHMYNQVRGLPTMPSRDVFEKRAMLYCIANNIPIIGVCRGAQLMCAIAGGSLVQHCHGHNSGTHDIVTVEGEHMQCTSAHHQMMVLQNVPHELLAWSKDKRSRTYEDGWGTNIEYMKTAREPEIVYFPTVKGLAIQGHPEWMSKSDRFCEYVNELIEEKLLKHIPIEV